jgi:hypothetical protein
MSTTSRLPPLRSAVKMLRSTPAGSAWSWIASKTVTASKASVSFSWATSRRTKLALASPRLSASVRAAVIASSEKS